MEIFGDGKCPGIDDKTPWTTRERPDIGERKIRKGLGIIQVNCVNREVKINARTFVILDDAYLR
jgi:hypothetical protein